MAESLLHTMQERVLGLQILLLLNPNSPSLLLTTAYRGKYTEVEPFLLVVRLLIERVPGPKHPHCMWSQPTACVC